MLEHGLTTIPECWNGDEGNSLNHPVFGVISEWMYRWLAGIRIDPIMPGYQHFILAPEMPEELEFVEARLDCMYGCICSSWKRLKAGYSLQLCILQSTNATVLLPEIAEPCRHTLSQIVTVNGSNITKLDRDISTGRKKISLTAGQYEIYVTKG